MEYRVSTTELTLKYGRTASTVIKVLTENGLKSKDEIISGHHCKMWPVEAYTIMDQYHGDNTVYISEYAKQLGVDESMLRAAMHKTNHFGVLRVVPDKAIEDEVNKLKKEEIAISKDVHPLVTDKRWLQLSNWPDTVPKCFEELDGERCGNW